MRRVVLMRAWLLSAAGCSGSGSAPAAPTAPAVVPSASSIAISNFSVRRAGTGTDCGIDEQNPSYVTAPLLGLRAPGE